MVVKAVPLILTTDPLTKFVPVQVTVVAEEPTVTELGDIDVKVGTGLEVTV